MTRQEYKEEIIYCFGLNEKLRRENKIQAKAFLTVLILGALLIPICTVGAIFSYISSSFTIEGIYLGLGIFGIFCLGFGIWGLIDSKKELKKCDEMDESLNEQLHLLTLENEERDISA